MCEPTARDRRVAQEFIDCMLTGHQADWDIRLAEMFAAVRAEGRDACARIEDEMTEPQATPFVLETLIEKFLGDFLAWARVNSPNSSVADNARRAAEAMIDEAYTLGIRHALEGALY